MCTGNGRLPPAATVERHVPCPARQMDLPARLSTNRQGPGVVVLWTRLAQSGGMAARDGACPWPMERRALQPLN
ncbi:hypothetical protein GGTG_10140 [Gaeumannomyces tritici R3-111a-1]|uniref:Uncharacterized protein n=1 Tax=Gaeumannomyces tritici (strain R3-111a-1) TaxID=644352 RepID=J3P9F9_GAET3|nr:hypothetical protein GGTG_10140 [Gaeumannomyces tritici R3-111a-1]EJT73295.1 hypothetical protein GGTG_10140 [Gaeumannomyces tritici R3-111a-1]